MNAGYIITDSIHIGNAEFVLGVNSKAPAQFVTWECKDGNNYFWGHYCTSLFAAQKDLCERAMTEIHILEPIDQSKENVPTIKPKNKERDER
jgi:hypothetical protein